MKLIHFIYKNKEYIGKVEEENILPIKEINKKNVKNFLDILSEEFNDIIYYDFKLNMEEVKLLPPLIHPIRNVFCLGKNYKDHAMELKNKIKTEESIPKNPIYFSKACYNLITDGDNIEGHFDITRMLDYEVELAIIISKEGRNIKKKEVSDYIFGYAIANDISARDLQKNHMQWLKGKSLDTHMALSAVVLKENHLIDFNIKSYVNDELRQNSSSSKMIFTIDEMIEDLSKGMTLYPGDIILTGTPEGVGMGFNPPKYLKRGDIIRCEIDKIGILENEII